MKTSFWVVIGSEQIAVRLSGGDLPGFQNIAVGNDLWDFVAKMYFKQKAELNPEGQKHDNEVWTDGNLVFRKRSHERGAANIEPRYRYEATGNSLFIVKSDVDGIQNALCIGISEKNYE